MTDTCVPEGYEAFCARRRDEILGRVARACARAGRDASEVEVVAVSKTVGTGEVLAAVGAGWRRFAENRPQELVRKLGALASEPAFAASGATFDMIGNLQTNKVNQVLGRARLVHSVNSEHLGRAIATRSEARGLVTPVLLEVNVSGEATKSGMGTDEAGRVLEGLQGMPGIRVEGLMAMAPAHDADAARRTFSGLRELAGRLRAASGLALPTLSCGMSDDFEIAVEEGSTLVRLGRVAFDPGYRPPCDRELTCRPGR